MYLSFRARVPVPNATRPSLQLIQNVLYSEELRISGVSKETPAVVSSAMSSLMYDFEFKSWPIFTLYASDISFPNLSAKMTFKFLATRTCKLKRKNPLWMYKELRVGLRVEGRGGMVGGEGSTVKTMDVRSKAVKEKSEAPKISRVMSFIESPENNGWP